MDKDNGAIDAMIREDRMDDVDENVAPWRDMMRNANRPSPPEYAAEEKQFRVPVFVAPPQAPLPSVPPPAAQPLPQAPAGERVLRRPAEVLSLLREHVQWDAAQNQLLRQNAPLGTRVLVTPAPFTPVAVPMLAPVLDPKALEERIAEIKARVPQVDFSLEAIKARRAFLGRVNEQRRAAYSRFMQQIRDWSRAEEEYNTLREYDEAVENFTKDLEHAKKVLGGSKKRARSIEEEEDL
jgi:hypothetical protein